MELDCFCWSLRGTLLRVRQGDLDAVEMDEGFFSSNMTVENKKVKFYWEIVNVYGPVRNERKCEFLKELYQKNRRC
jgi:hypothetical protein